MRNTAYRANGHAIKAAREKAGHSRASFSKLAEISPRLLFAVEEEDHTPMPNRLKRIADALAREAGVSFEDITMPNEVTTIVQAA